MRPAWLNVLLLAVAGVLVATAAACTASEWGAPAYHRSINWEAVP